MICELERIDEHPGLVLDGAQHDGRRPNTAPPYYLGHPASLWISVMRTGSASRHRAKAVTGEGRTPSHYGDPAAAGTETPVAVPRPDGWPTIRELARAHRETDGGSRTPVSAGDAIWLAWAVHDQWPWGGR